MITSFQEYSEDSNSEPDVDLENQYYNSKSLKEDDPKAALNSFQKVCFFFPCLIFFFLNLEMWLIRYFHYPVDAFFSCFMNLLENLYCFIWSLENIVNNIVKKWCALYSKSNETWSKDKDCKFMSESFRVFFFKKLI